MELKHFYSVFCSQDSLEPQDFQVPKVSEAQKVTEEHQAVQASLVCPVLQAYQGHQDSEVPQACQDLKVHNTLTLPLSSKLCPSSPADQMM